MLVSLLHDAGKLPQPPIVPDGSAFGFRKPSIADMQTCTWVLQWHGPRTDATGFRNVNGIAAYRDGYDFHTASDVREVVYLAGTPRAVFALLRWIGNGSVAAGRRAIGAVDLSSATLRRGLARMGNVETRVMVEAA